MKRRTKNKKKREWLKDLLKNKLRGWTPKQPNKGPASQSKHTA